MPIVNTRRDIMVDTNRDIIIGDNGDIRLTETREEYLSNFLAIRVGEIVRELIGNPRSGAVYESARSQIYDALQSNDQIGSVLTVDITEINTETGTITINVQVQENDNFELEVDA